MRAWSSAFVLGLARALVGCGGDTAAGFQPDASTDSNYADASTGDSDRSGSMVVATGFTDVAAMISDGTTLFVSNAYGKLASVPSRGGATTTLVSTGSRGWLFGADQTNVYFVLDDGVYMMPKVGGAQVRLNLVLGADGGMVPASATTFADGAAYWAEITGPTDLNRPGFLGGSNS